MKLIGRQKELKFIEEFYFSSKTPILYLYGARGIGKTALLYAFIEKNLNLVNDNYFLCYGFNLFNQPDILFKVNKDLIIIDSFETSPKEISIILNNLVDKNPKQKIIISCTEKPLFITTEIIGRVIYLELGSFTREELKNIIRETVKSKETNKLYQLFVQEKLLDYFNNNPHLIITALNYLISNSNLDIDALRSFIETPIKQSGLIDINGHPLSLQSEKGKIISDKIIIVNESLIQKAFLDPKFIFNIPSYKFEHLVAELLEKEGFSVKITKKTHDGGKDILIAHNNILGNFLFYVECKQYSLANHIGVKLVRELYGTIAADRATAGLLVTTSYFSKAARDFVENVQNQLSLKDYLDLQNWITNIYRKNYGV